MRRSARIALGAALLILTLFLVALTARQGRREPLYGNLLEPPLKVADFVLTSASGPVRKSDFGGRLVVLVFGYTSCPDVCPTTLAKVARARELLGPAARDVQVLFITVDPERDTPEKMGEYARAFAPDFIGLSGRVEEVDRVAALFGIFHAKAEGSPVTGYLVDHTATVTVLDQHGNARLLWGFNTRLEEMASDLRNLIADT